MTTPFHNQTTSRSRSTREVLRVSRTLPAVWKYTGSPRPARSISSKIPRTPSPRSTPNRNPASARAIRRLLASRVTLEGSPISTSPGNRPGLSISIRSSNTPTRMWSPPLLYDRCTTALTSPSSQASCGMSDTRPNRPSAPRACRVGTAPRTAARAASSCSERVPHTGRQSGPRGARPCRAPCRGNASRGRRPAGAATAALARTEGSRPR